MERPSPTDQRSERVVASERATRLAAVNARRARSAPSAAPSRDGVQRIAERDALNARLDALAGRRSLPPPQAPAGALAQSPSGRRPRRRHAARGARAAALGLSLASTGALATLFAVTGSQTSAGTQVATAAIVASPRSATPTDPASASSTSTAAPTSPATDPTATPAPAGNVASPAIVDGAVFNNKWGDVQVEATFASDGTLLAVTTLQTPYRDGKSVRINDRAVPQLNSEALTTQSANVDTVSGATYTSNDYRRSLQSAIDTARAAGLTAIA